MDHRNRRLSMEPLESRHMLSVGTECTAPEDITALQGQQVAAIEATLDVQSEREQISPLLSQTFEGAQAAFNGSRAIDLGYNPQYNLQDFTIHTKALCTKEGGEQVIVGLNTQANRSYGYSGVTLNFSREGGVLKLWYAGPDTNYEVFTHFTPQLRREYDIIVIKQGGVLQLFVDGEHVEDIQLPMEKIVYNSTGRTMVSGLWSGEKRSALYQLNGAVSELEVYGDVYMPEKLQQAGGQTTAEEIPLAEKNADPVQEAQPAQSSPLLSQAFEGAQAAFNGSRAIDLGYNPEYNLQDFTIHATIVAKGSEAEQVIVGLNTQANGVYGYSGVTLNCRYGNGPLKLWYAAPGTNHEVITSFQPEIGREYDIVVVKQGKQLRLFVDGEHFEDLICPVAEIRYNDTGRTMVSGLWSGTKKSGIYPFHGAISTLEIFDGAYEPKERGAWEEIGIEDFIVPELRVLQIEGPNVLVHVASPTNQSIVNIGGNGVLATRTQLHEGGTPSTVMQVTMNAGNSRGHYAIQLTDRPGGLVLDSIPVYWNGSSLSLRNAEDGMEGVPAEWDIPAEYSMSSALVRNNLESDLAARSGLTYSLAQAEAAFYERHPEYLPQNLNATIDAEYARLPGFTRGQAQDRVLGDKFDLLARVQRGLNAFNGVLQGQVFPAAMNVFRGVLDGVPERTLYEQLDAAMCSFGRGIAVHLFLYTTITT
ncbi:MAG: LamG-like jellyroll fold domain-containing protein, partial [Candidatus Peribacteraceae bacterium]